MNEDNGVRTLHSHFFKSHVSDKDFMDACVRFFKHLETEYGNVNVSCMNKGVCDFSAVVQEVVDEFKFRGEAVPPNVLLMVLDYKSHYLFKSAVKIEGEEKYNVELWMELKKVYILGKIKEYHAHIKSREELLNRGR